MRYDAAIIGADCDGLTAAIAMAAEGLRVAVIDTTDMPGGALTAHEFHPGFRASLFCDEIGPIPPAIYWALGLARRGVLCAPPSMSLALWPDARSVIGKGHGVPACALFKEALRKSAAALVQAEVAARNGSRRWLPFLRASPLPVWPEEEWAQRSLVDVLAERVSEPRLAAHVMAVALAGRTADPFLAGSALHLLAPAGGTIAAGGPGEITATLARLAVSTGAEMISGAQISDIRRDKRGLTVIALWDGRDIAARAVISTRDPKRTFLAYSAWKDLPEKALARVRAFRMGSGMARILFALNALPPLPAPASRGPIHVTPAADGFVDAYRACRSGLIPDHPPTWLRVVSATDPSLAPAGKAVMTATLSAIPFRLLDGAWTNEKRAILYRRALDAASVVLPEIANHILATKIVAPPDFEDGLGVTEGDPWGGEIAADQMLGFRPRLDCAPPRTPITGLYLAGRSTAVGVQMACASGVLAARAVLADFKAGLLK